MSRQKIYTPTPFYVYLIGLLLGGAFIALCFGLFAKLVRTEEGLPPIELTEAELAELAASRDINNFPEPYSLHAEIPESEFAAARAILDGTAPAGLTPPAWFPKNESPILRELVEEGKLPPVAERVGPEPVVMEGVDGIGTYGGTWLRLATHAGDVVLIAHRLSGATFTRFSPMGDPLVPHLMREIEILDDYRTFIFHFRKGLRWSDGHPVTSNDMMFWWEHEINAPSLAMSFPVFMISGGERATVTQIDDYTARVDFPISSPLFLERLAVDSRNMLVPAHYRRQFHPDLGDPEFLAQKIQEFGLANARTLYKEMQHFLNPQHPRLWPWIPAEFRSLPPYTFVRNPYYYVVDTQGNQLPYIDRLQFEVQGQNMIGVAAANGKVSMQARHLRFNQYTEFMGRRRQAGTDVYLWLPEGDGAFAISPNSNRRIDPARPDTRWKARLLADKRFRQALSVAINREVIVRAYYNDLTVPAQAAPGPLSPFHAPELRNAFIQFDPDLANAKLDEIWRDLDGDPTLRDAEGYRVFPDGTRMTFYLDASSFTGIGPSQFIVDDWKEIGLRVVLRERQRTLFFVEAYSRDFDMNIWGGSGGFPTLNSGHVATTRQSLFANGWGYWYNLGGLFGAEAANVPAAIPVPEGHPMHEAMLLQAEASITTSLERQKELLARIHEIGAENLWFINLTTAPPTPVVVSADIRNVPRRAVESFSYLSPSNTGIETYFFENPVDSAGAIAAAREAILNRPPMPAMNQAAGERTLLSKLVRNAFKIIALLLLVNLVVRHPFVGRRLVLMIPTLIIISICVFTIIQLPPGDYLTSRMIQLQETGEDPETVQQEIEYLKEIFHTEDPAWKRYLRWTGVFWFTSFEDKDKGLLQGDMGRSMETTRSVNTMIGDRLILTFFISLGTILFTWIIALPIGIYSAVRQHSVSDYLITILGFLGLCIPNFLLALILMTLGNVSGLFSPEYMIQPEWTWGKVVDLLKHIWVPIVVMGTSGTASMIRTMRANLLDELRKPYVTTARAKGMPPRRLLLKYPVRIALNPFISGIGGIFPQLVSGGAVVAIVLSLPTVGPLMVSALFSQDMNVAGSMLMLLSLLGVIGTLVSDLLLMWVDPRIRMEGGKK